MNPDLHQQDELVNAARLFAKLADANEQGVASWHTMMERAFQILAAAVDGERARRAAR